MTDAPDESMLRLEPGSPRQMSALYAGPARRPCLHALYALEQEVRSGVSAMSHEVAHVRQQFWRDEVNRLLAGRPAHPLTQALRDAPGGHQVDFTPLHELLTAVDLDLARFTYSTRRELDAYAVRAGAVQGVAIGLLADGRPLSDGARRFASALGRVLRHTETLALLQAEARAGRIYAPLDELQAIGVDAADVQREPMPPPLVAWRRSRAADLRTELDVVADTLSTDERRSLLPSRVLGAQYALWLGSIAASDGRDLPVERVSNWRRVWTAWRTALGHGRG